MLYAAVLVIGILGAAGDLVLYRWSKSNELWELLLGLLLWIVSLVAFGYLLRYGGRSLSVVFILTAVAHSLIVLGWDIFSVSRRVSFAEGIGIGTALVGVLIIEWASMQQEAE